MKRKFIGPLKQLTSNKNIMKVETRTRNGGTLDRGQFNY